MNRICKKSKRVVPALLLVCAIVFTYGCASLSNRRDELPPLLAQDELLRPYNKLAAIQVTRERYGSPVDLTSADYDWAYRALRQEAAKVGADAVILPEVKVELDRFIIFPISEMKARGVAIKFR